MTPQQLSALQEYVSATCYFMLRSQAGGEVHRFLYARDRLENAFGQKLPHGPTPPGEPQDTPAPSQDFADVFDTTPAPAPRQDFPDLL